MRTGKGVRGRRPAGFTYIGLLIVIAVIGIFLASAGNVWHLAAQRERERQLLFVGGEMRAAIGRYYSARFAGASQFPQSLADLLRDPRTPSVERYLRKLYVDPMTGGTEWGLVRDKDDRIVGVYSLSEDRPIKQAGFSAGDSAFEGRQKYSQWVFVYQPKAARVPGKAQPPT